jgi:flagellar biosynthesis/type III secretory pathway M-ring protein FliF/YscJ
VRVTAALEAAEAAEKQARPEPEKPQIEAKAQPSLPSPEVVAQVESLRENVRQTVNRDPVAAAGVIRNWIAQTEAR